MSEDFTAEMPLPQKPQRRPALQERRESERLSVGGFFAEHRKTIDERKGHLARLGMDPLHVDALRMPPVQDEPLPARGTRMPILTAPVPESTEAAEVAARAEEHVPSVSGAPSKTRGVTGK